MPFADSDKVTEVAEVKRLRKLTDYVCDNASDAEYDEDSDASVAGFVSDVTESDEEEEIGQAVGGGSDSDGTDDIESPAVAAAAAIAALEAAQDQPVAQVSAAGATAGRDSDDEDEVGEEEEEEEEEEDESDVEVACHAYLRLGAAEFRRVQSRESGTYVPLDYAVDDDDGDDEAAEGVRLVGWMAGHRVYQMELSAALRALQQTVLRTAVGLAYVDVRAPAVTKSAVTGGVGGAAAAVGEAEEDVVNGFFAVRPSPLGGLGCFAVRDIERCQHIVVERPLVRTTLLHLTGALARLSAEQRHQYDALHGWHPDPSTSHAEQVWTANTFVAGSSHEAVFAIASRFNHACGSSRQCNVDYRFDRRVGVLVLTTVRKVAAGEELCISYGKDPRIMEARFGFRCACESCGDGQAYVEDVTKW